MDEKDWVQELFTILKKSDKPSDWLKAEKEKGYINQFLPELSACEGIEQNKYHKYDVYHHLIYSCDAAEKRLEIRLAALLHDIGKPFCKKGDGEGSSFYNHEIIGTDIAYKILKRWHAPGWLVRKVTLLVRHHMFHYRDNWTDSAVRRIMRKVGRENMEDLFLVRVADREGNGFRKGEPLKLKDFRERIARIVEEEKRFKVKDLKIAGQDLLDLGMKPGPAMGKLLKELCVDVVAGNLENEREPLLEEVKKRVAIMV